MATSQPLKEVKTEGSPPWQLAKKDLVKAAKGAGIAVVGALLTYTSETIIPGLGPEHRLYLAPLLMVLVNLGQKWVSNTCTTTVKEPAQP